MFNFNNLKHNRSVQASFVYYLKVKLQFFAEMFGCFCSYSIKILSLLLAMLFHIYYHQQNLQECLEISQAITGISTKSAVEKKLVKQPFCIKYKDKSSDLKMPYDCMTIKMN